MRRRHWFIGILTWALVSSLGAQQNLQEEVRPLWDKFQAALAEGDTESASEHLATALRALRTADPTLNVKAAADWRYWFGEAALSTAGFDPATPIAIFRDYVEFWEHADPTDWPDQFATLQTARGRLATALSQRDDARQQDFEEAEQLRQLVVTEWEDAGEAQGAAFGRVYLGQMLILRRPDTRGLEGLKELESGYETIRTTAPDTGWQAWAAAIFANSLVDMGQEFDARVLELQSAALGIYNRALAAREAEEPPNPDAIGELKSNIVQLEWETANILQRHGMLQEARRLAQHSYEQASLLFGEDALETTWPRSFYASVLMDSGDEAMARELNRKVMEIRVRNLPPRHTNLMMGWNSYGHALMLNKRWDEAIEAFQEALEAYDPRDPSIIAITNYALVHDNLGQCLAETGRTDDAIELLEHALETVRSQVAKAQIQGGMGMALQRAGRLDEAANYFEMAIPTVKKTQGFRQPMYYLQREALTLAALGETEQLQSCLEELLEVADHAIDHCYLLPGRPAYELAALADGAAQQVLALCDKRFKLKKAVVAQLEQRAFEILESLRSIELRVANLTARLPDNPEIQALLRAARAARAELSRRAALGTGDSAEIQELAAKRDELENTALSAMRSADLPATRVTLDAIADALPKNAAAVAFRAVTTIEPDAKNPGKEIAQQVFEAHVVTRKAGEARFERVSLGDPEVLRDGARRWLQEILAKDTRSRPARNRAAPDPVAPLDKFLFGKLGPKLAGAKTLVVCLDDVLHTIPVELLPGAKDLELRYAVSLADLVAPQDTPLRAESLFVVGGIDFDELPAEEPDATPDEATGDDAGGSTSDLRSSTPFWTGEVRVSKFFPALDATGPEAEAIAKLFQKRFSVPAVLRTDRQVSHETCTEEAQRARSLHFATHGYFLMPDPEEVSARDRAVRGFAPMSLCGLALTGANKTGDDGYVGVLTGEEIAALDLTGCELAVLSACETYLGVPRPGHGLASLQSALHAAGVHVTITSRWTIPDTASARLMEQFYARYWRGMPARDALDEAKAEIRRADGGALAEPFFWAGFVLTGSPGG